MDMNLASQSTEGDKYDQKEAFCVNCQANRKHFQELPRIENIVACIKLFCSVGFLHQLPTKHSSSSIFR